ncbi:phage tail protein [Endozoicomonas ascidiicola]|uniref:phage tail protein n=1 Tax=Endozoicomonas ascidiicola TaxID=1698521 RepID=UPI000834F3BF|nr:phage tail protein [Endozoicomonas ascidiicola]
MSELTLQPINIHLDGDSTAINVEMLPARQDIVVNIPDALPLVAELATVVEADRQEVADNLADVVERHGDIVERHDDIVLKHGEVDEDRQFVEESRQDITDRQADIVTRHGEIEDWHDAHDEDQRYFSDLRDDIVQSETDYQATVDAVQRDTTAAETARTESERIQGEIETAYTDIQDRQDTIETIQTDVTTKHDEVEADRAEVETNLADVETRQTDIISRQDDVIARQTAVNDAATQALSDIATEGDAELAEIASEGDSQFTRVQTEGQSKVDEVTVLADQVSADTATTVAAKDDAEIARDEAIAARDSLTGSYVDAGTLDASTGLLPATPLNSSMWHITVAGTMGGIEYGAGDVLAFTTSDNSFYKIDNTESVYSVNGYHGVVSLTYTDVNALSDTTTVTDLGGYTIAQVDAAVDGVQVDLDGYKTSNDAAVAILQTEVATAQSTADAKTEEAPNDGQQYVRKDESWEQVSVDVNEAPQDGEQYVRKDADWEQVSVDVNEAPADGEQYVRKDQDWEQVDFSGAVVDPPLDGKLYFRKNGEWIAVEDSYLESSPVGISAYWDGSETPPTGWLERNGDEIDQATYPELYEFYKDKVEVGKAFLPDDRGEFWRGWDHGRGVDGGRELGSDQSDEFKSHYHSVQTTKSLDFHAHYPHSGISAGSSSNSGVSAGSSTYSGGSETRPRNRAMMPIIKAIAGPNLISQIAVPQRSVYNATAGQKTFNHLYEAGRPLSLYMNGVKLIKGLDFTADNGTSIVLNSPLIADADLEIESLGKLVLSDMIGDSVHDGQYHVRKDGTWEVMPEKTVDYALLDFGTVTNNNRYVQVNPFGNDTPVLCVAEVYHNSKWSQIGFIYSSSSTKSYGITASYISGEGVVIQTGDGRIMPSKAVHSGSGADFTTPVTSAPCRVHVWRVGV